MSGDSSASFSFLHRTCKLLVLLCLLHISVTVFLYVRSLDFRLNFVQNQRSRNHNPTVPSPLTASGPVLQPEPKEVDFQREQHEEPQHLEGCPDTSPLLCKNRVHRRTVLMVL